LTGFRAAPFGGCYSRHVALGSAALLRRGCVGDLVCRREDILKSGISSETDPDAGARRWPVESDRGEHVGGVGLAPAIESNESATIRRWYAPPAAGSGLGGNGGLSADDLLDLCIGENAPQSLVDLFTVHA
jgi:hypothetical protein